ncbi:hypothetical protein OIU77_001540 [Salix suchowensis]|uniref:Elongator complex protein 5 n=1 Tax=Salix suchowensis TaxID=1278906 RepID=A0ABQ9B1U0_9ROSI|nr:hypothetical protein OIU77_001540 [Salix suchowensis]
MPQLKVSLYFACETWKLPVNCQSFLMRIGLVPYFMRKGIIKDLGWILGQRYDVGYPFGMVPRTQFQCWINEMLRHTSTSTVAGLLSNLRSHGISISALSRLSLIIDFQRLLGLGNLSLLEQNFGKGKLQVRLSAKMDELFNLINQGHLPKVQFSLDLSEEERIGRAKATLGSIGDSQKAEYSGEGEIICFRDSDDEMPDSDEDPDDDLDI